jgi:hypothetical protein
MRTLVGALVFSTALFAAARDASAQDSRWESWLGCWERINDGAGESVQPSDDAAPDQAVPEPNAAVASAPPRVCVTRSGPNGVTLTTTVPGRPTLEQALVPDGTPRPVAENDCRGTEQSEWSSNGRRLFARAQVTCRDGSARTISGLAMITEADVWLDIRSFNIGEQPLTRVSRYIRVESDTALRIPALGGPPLTFAEIKEASSKVSSAVLEAAIAETAPFLPVSKRTLVDLADARVPAGVLDVLVANAYPDRFVVERSYGARQANAGTAGPGQPHGIDDYYATGYYYPPYYYAPFGYAYVGFYDPFLFPGYCCTYIGGGGGGGIIVDGDGDIPSSGRARAVNGLGYTRPKLDEPGQAVPRTRTAETSAVSISNSGSPRATTSTAGSSSGSGSSSSGVRFVSPSGFSNGGGGSSATAGSGGGNVRSADSGGGGGGGASSSGGGSNSGGGGNSGGNSGGGNSGGNSGGGDTGRTAQPR